MQGWMNHMLESRLLQETSTTSVSYADDTTLMAESEAKQKNLFMRVKEENGKAGKKLNFSKK